MHRSPIACLSLGLLLPVALAGGAGAAPRATGARRPLYQGTTAVWVPWVNDSVSTDTFTFGHVQQPADGTASAVNGGQALEYVPDASFTSGTDSFKYRATSQDGKSVTGTARVRVYDTTALTRCTRIGEVNGDGTIKKRTFAQDCTFYSRRQTRVKPDGTAVTMDYFVNWPSASNTLKAVVVLIGGGDLDMGFSGDTTHGVPVESGGGNFVVRTAQMFAEAGYLAIAINKPSDQPPPGSTDSRADADQYRISVDHAVDILSVLKHFDTQDLPVFLAGTSVGALSAVAANRIATGVSLSSPVTSADSVPSHLYVGAPGVANLEPGFVERPVHVLWHTADGCAVSTPAGSQALFDALSTTTPSAFATVSGGVRVTATGNGLGSSDIGPCEAFDYHGYFGIETTTVGGLTAWLDDRIGGHTSHVPAIAPFETVKTASGAPKNTDLAPLLGSPAGVSYGLSHTTTSLGGSVTISGSTVTYTPPAGVSGETDYYVYVVTDGLGGVGAGVITVKIGN